jgi:FGGY-family pentulose kinase
MQDEAVIGVDVGTGSARAGIFTPDGLLLSSASHPIRIWHRAAAIVQQSSADIWQAVTQAVRTAHALADHVPIRGIGFDATCSLVVLDAAGAPVSVDPDGDPAQDVPVQDVIVWMDHRAAAQAARINHGAHAVLRHVGGQISPEMQTPKLLWLKENASPAWRKAATFLDLPDFLTWRATGSASRSLCSTVCKWTYVGHEQRWDEAYFHAIGLGDLADENFSRIGTEILPIGAPTGDGLSPDAAAELGLPIGTAVGTSAIDAHAGGLGVIGATLADDRPLQRRLALIGGTSSCHMAVSPDPRFIQGIWGPYKSAMIPGQWLNEGGQSATGSLIDHVITTHPAFQPLVAHAAGKTIYEILNARLAVLSRDLPHPAALTHGLHVMPDFHGNRSPRADSSARGMISGLSLSATADDLAVLYLATLQAIAYGTRHIIETLNLGGYEIDTILACGGGTRNPVFLREHADATGCTIILPREPEAVLLGSAMLGAVAGGLHPDIQAAMAAMSHAGEVIAPTPGDVRAYHDAKYAIFRRMYDDQVAYADMMRGPARQ